MAKDKEKRIAFDYYTKQGLTAKAISEIIPVSEKTIGTWVEAGKWKAVRDANVNTSLNQANNIKELISEMTEQQLQIAVEIKAAKATGDNNLVSELRKQSSALSQEVAIQTKALERLEDGKLSLSTYLSVMNDIFQGLEQYDKNLYHNTLEFQESHLQTISVKLG